jgi:predicted permease
MAFNLVAKQIITLLIILSVGYIAKKNKTLDNLTTTKLATFLIYITSPALIFNSFLKQNNFEKLVVLGYIALGSLICFLITIALAEKFFFFFLKKDSTELVVLKASSVFSNCGYMGIPIISELYGPDGVLYVSIYVVIFQILLWTYGITLFSEKTDNSDIKKLLYSPTIIAVILGLLVSFMKIPVYASIESAVEMVGSMTTPLAMLIIGSNMGEVKFKEVITGWKIYYISFIRLIFIPVIFIIIFHYIPIPDMAEKIILTSLTMPVGVNVAVFAEKFNKDSLFASKVITLTTILSMFTIPLMLTFL